MEDIARRDFLKLAAGQAAAGLALAGKSADKLIPYVVPPEHMRPGVFAFFATTCRECPAGCGMHLWHRDGRVTKAEGNPDHPINAGAPLRARPVRRCRGSTTPTACAACCGGGPDGGLEPRRRGTTAIAAVGGRLRQRAGRVVLISDLQTGALARS